MDNFTRHQELSVVQISGISLCIFQEFFGKRNFGRKIYDMKKFNYVVFREGKYFVSQCLNVEVSSFGETISEAVANLNEALQLYFQDNDASSEILRIEETSIGETFINV